MTKVHSRIIVEILGSPEKHVKEVINLVVDKIKHEKDTKIIKESISEPKEVKGFISMFAEMELETPDVTTLMNICFDYMPSSVEILGPDKLEFNSRYLTDLMNDILAKLHQYDMVMKNLYAQSKMLERKLSEKK